MATKEYIKVLEHALKIQIEYILENSDYEKSEYLQGQEVGLRIALRKIEDSKFLIEDEECEEVV